MITYIIFLFALFSSFFSSGAYSIAREALASSATVFIQDGSGNSDKERAEDNCENDIEEKEEEELETRLPQNSLKRDCINCFSGIMNIPHSIKLIKFPASSGKLFKAPDTQILRL